MPGLLTNVDPDGLLEYSVVFTDRSLNHMSQSFQKVMNDISKTLKKAYNAKRSRDSLLPVKNVLLFEMVGLVSAGPRFLKQEVFLLNPRY
jgi:aspartate aminotransferase-like enzyme